MAVIGVVLGADQGADGGSGFEQNRGLGFGKLMDELLLLTEGMTELGFNRNKMEAEARCC